ncbi:Uncharacterised protein [Serratia ficaria]|uniref:hypothetical protein n=1 Tax=Serratia ficaria TaxID=61651 RepID=UPI0021774D71|nr:hypothetical protein [Serratia ficaria]CAI0711013.1 Uncharacterised protein [Serratia ficaria]CAI1037521.1 Uncharacterised protein [Serratia ficaria]CAI1997444.1 Uncharacterised protein [Serratia ficaria]CAI2433963.1 Uncharacterised protein [Serratia ficaria]CAI2475525.1 Uncharacterised protein [Serratia ficaria]
MNWQGIPYKFISEDTANTVNLALQSIPKIIVDTPTDYTSPFITGVVSLIAGIIPAGIAIWTFKRNATNTKMERERQEIFLTNERAEQQRFLQEERAAQIASTEKDRQTQLLIAKQNFDMQVLSLNRQQWINNLRDLLAEYLAMIPLLLDARFKYLNKHVHYNKVYEQGESDPERYGLEFYRNELNRRTSELNESLASLDELRTQERLLNAKIKIMLNPKEKWYTDFKLQTSKVIVNYSDLNDLDINKYKEKLAVQEKCVESILILTQELLKYEWERVKKGV